jgi:NAD(P)H-dependent FMN reductase
MTDEIAIAGSVRFERRRNGALVKIIATGHPPPAEQIARQVRSSGGMTFGVPTFNGPAKMPPAFTRCASIWRRV